MDTRAVTHLLHNNRMNVLVPQCRYVPILSRTPSPEPLPPPPPPVVDERLSPGPSDATGRVTPDEILTLGVLALAGLWPGTWVGIAAVIVKQVDQLARNGAADIPFRRCAMSIVDMLLKTPGDPTVAVETWRHLAAAQARLPHDLQQVLGLACSLLQSRTMEAAETRARKKRRRTASADTMAAMSMDPTRFAHPCAAAVVSMMGDIRREEESGRKERAEEGAEGKASPEQESEPVSLISPHQQLLSLPIPLTPETNISGVHLDRHMSPPTPPPPPPHSLDYEPPLQHVLPASPGYIQSGASGWGMGSMSSNGAIVDLGAAGGGLGSSPTGPSGLGPHSLHSHRGYEWDVTAGSQMEYYPPPEGQFSPPRYDGGGGASPRGFCVAESGAIGGGAGALLP